jgi:hypothetical protein
MEAEFDYEPLSALEIDEINHNCPELDAEEQAIHDKYCNK